MPLILCTKEESENYLAHFRTKGSKNGVRLYQNEDGSYTALGRIHYGIGKARSKIHKDLAESSARKADKLATKAAKAEANKEVAKAKYALHPYSPGSKAKFERLSNKATRSKLKLAIAENKKASHELAAKTIENRDSMNKEDKLNAKAEKLKLASERNKLLGQKYGSDELTAKGKDQELKSDLLKARANKEGLDSAIQAEKEAKKEAQAEEQRKTQALENKHKTEMKIFDDLDPRQKQAIGDSIMKQFGEDIANRDSDPQAAERYRETEKWLMDRMNKKSGMAVCARMDPFKPGSQGEKAYKKLESNWEEQNAREDEIKRDMRYREGNAKDYKRFKQACENDSIWKALRDNSKKSESALCSAVLRDIGLSDTPENRELIEWYVFLD